MKKTRTQLRKVPLAERVIALIEGARQKVAYTANLAQVYTNYEIGRQIVEEEQGGKRRAGYGEKVIEELSAKLTARYGKGWSEPSLWRMRQFYLLYSDSLNTVEGIDVLRNSLNGVERVDRSATAFRISGGAVSPVTPRCIFASELGTIQVEMGKRLECETQKTPEERILRGFQVSLKGCFRPLHRTFTWTVSRSA